MFAVVDPDPHGASRDPLTLRVWHFPDVVAMRALGGVAFGDSDGEWAAYRTFTRE
eukprot:m.431813 g.431813  ORF g.431813 m.431813 type:complete len:55 (-) comp17350_c0_seq1:6922-7086(-)